MPLYIFTSGDPGRVRGAQVVVWAPTDAAASELLQSEIAGIADPALAREFTHTRYDLEPGTSGVLRAVYNRNG